MDTRSILESLAQGNVSVDEALLQLKKEPFTDLGYAKVDHHRALRQGAAEVIYGAGKTPEQIAGICASMLCEDQGCILVTRVDADAAEQVRSRLAHLVPEMEYGFAYHELARIIVVGEMPEPDGNGEILVACAGTSDLPVAEEAALTAQALGNRVNRLYDVGVAGIHRLLSHTDEIMSAQVIIAVAGMEGALASVVGGLSAAPVIAVPTSVGYGASLGGVAALLSMLNSCASGVSVVNIDNGFGAAFQAHQINHLPGASETLRD